MIANSILNLKEKRLILSPEDDPHISSELREQRVGLSEEGVGPSEGVGLYEEPAIVKQIPE